MIKPTVAEIRCWRRDQRNDKKFVGKIFNDLREIFFDGDDAVIIAIAIHESPTYFILEDDLCCFRAEKSEEDTSDSTW